MKGPELDPSTEGRKGERDDKERIRCKQHKGREITQYKTQACNLSVPLARVTIVLESVRTVA